MIHHTDCGMETFTDEVIRGLLAQSLKTAHADRSGWHDSGDGPGSTAGEFMSFLPIRDRAQSVADEVQRIRSHPSCRATSRSTATSTMCVAAG